MTGKHEEVKSGGSLKNWWKIVMYVDFLVPDNAELKSDDIFPLEPLVHTVHEELSDYKFISEQICLKNWKTSSISFVADVVTGKSIIPFLSLR